MSGQLVGRAGELGAIDLALAELDRGEPAALVLVGEPGIGKTRMLAELAGRADGRGHIVLSGSGSELEGDVPFWVFVDALDEYLRGLDPARLASHEDVRAELAHVFPAVPAGDGAVPGLQNERYRTHRAVRTLLEGLAGTKPLVLVLDDLHWADSGSAELLGALLHRPPAAPVLLALAMRPRLVPERLLVSVERAQRAGTLTRIELEALSSEEAHELLGAHSDGAPATALYEESGGNPFYLEQLARGLTRDGTAPQTLSEKISLAEVQVPPTVMAALAQELGVLTDGTRLVMQGAAVAGDPFEPELAAAAAATDEHSAMDALDELLSVDLVRPTDVPRRFRFRHPLVRRAVYESTPGGWRLSAHERTAEALARRGAPVAARAHHVELSARPGDAAAVAVLREAGEAAAQRAPATAARWFDGALRLISERAPAEERVGLLLARAGSLAATGNLAESHAALLESIAVVPAEALALRVRLVVACAGVEHLLGRHPQALARLETALDELEDGESPEAVALMIELAVDGLYRTDFDAMLGWAERAVAVATSLHDRALTAAALAVRACGAALSGTAAEAQAQCEEAAQLVDRLSDDELARRLDALVYLATAEGYLDRFEPSGRHGQRALTIGRATGQGDLFPLMYAMLGTALWVQGRMAESVEVLDGAVEAARLVDSDHGLAWILFNRSFAAFAAGDLEHASATAEESAELASRLEPGPVTAWVAVLRAGLMLEAGEASRAADLLVAAAGGEELRMIGGGWRARCLELLTRCYLASGRRADAERSAEAARACSDAVQLPLAAAMAGLAEAALDLDSGDPANGGRRALDAAGHLEEIGDVVDAAHARLLAGRALAAAGDQDSAAAELERACAAFDSFGSTRHLAEAERALRKLGRHIHRRTKPGSAGDAGVASLTARELELARLVVDRKTNPQIAAELFLSQKTVETHLRNIFRKLDVHSRVDVARAIERADRAGVASVQEPPRITEAVSAERLTVERDRLQAEVRAKMEELRRSRARIVEAGDTERRRLERNLHDGAQQRLVSISLSLSMMERQLESPDQAAAVAALRSEVADALDELRELARGLHPAILVDHGLGPALEALAARASVPVEVDINIDSRLPAPIEAATYYVISEALTNVQKYAHASLAKVNVTLRDDEIVLEVVDNGVGGADATQGSGLQGLADRVEALAGSIAIESPSGGGTSLRARIPHERHHA